MVPGACATRRGGDTAPYLWWGNENALELATGRLSLPVAGRGFSAGGGSSFARAVGRRSHLEQGDRGHGGYQRLQPGGGAESQRADADGGQGQLAADPARGWPGS